MQYLFVQGTWRHKEFYCGPAMSRINRVALDMSAQNMARMSPCPIILTPSHTVTLRPSLQIL